MAQVKVCKDCGSDEMKYESHTVDGKREMYRCFECGNETFFKVTVKTLREIQEENTINLYTQWGKDQSK